jgi:drug/metabolite transporter (DMT)-like permease
VAGVVPLTASKSFLRAARNDASVQRLVFPRAFALNGDRTAHRRPPARRHAIRSLPLPTPPQPAPVHQPSLVPLALLLAVGVLLGLTANVVKIAAGAGWPPLAFLFWSALAAGAILLIVAVSRGEAPGRGRQDFAYYLGCGLLSIALPNALGYGAVTHVGASFVALCLALPPLLTYGLALLLKMETLRATRALGILTGLAGAAVLGAAKARGDLADPIWIIGALASPVFISFGNIYRTLSWPPGATALSLAPGMLIFGSALLAPVLAFAGISFAPAALKGSAAWLLAGQTAIFTATYALYFVLQKLAGPVYLSQIGSVAAIFGAALAVLALGEPANAGLLIAAALILAGVVLVNRRR